MKDVTLLRAIASEDQDGTGPFDAAAEVKLSDVFLHVGRLMENHRPPLIALEMAVAEVLQRATMQGQVWTEDVEFEEGKSHALWVRPDGATGHIYSRSQLPESAWSEAAKRRRSMLDAGAGRIAGEDFVGPFIVYWLRGNTCSACDERSDVGLRYEKCAWERYALKGMTVLEKANQTGGVIGLGCGCYATHLTEALKMRRQLGDVFGC